jgi:hypothetical protein
MLIGYADLQRCRTYTETRCADLGLAAGMLQRTTPGGIGLVAVADPDEQKSNGHEPYRLGHES